MGERNKVMKYERIDHDMLPEMAELFADTFNSPPWNDQWTNDTAFERLSLMMSAEGSYGVAAFEGDLLCGMILGEREVYYNGLHFCVKEFCVARNMQGTGLGGKMLAMLEEELVQLGYSHVYLLTSHGERTEGFYSKRGYSCGDMIVMSKRLPAKTIPFPGNQEPEGQPKQ